MLNVITGFESNLLKIKAGELPEAVLKEGGKKKNPNNNNEKTHHEDTSAAKNSLFHFYLPAQLPSKFNKPLFYEEFYKRSKSNFI